jgi:uncharacterized glyoxalase superfamily protein PhnB
MSLQKRSTFRPVCVVADIQKFHQDLSAKGVDFTMPPTKQDFGSVLAQFVEGGYCSVGGLG